MNRKILFGDLSYKLNGLFFQVHNELGRYKNEKQYADCFEQKLKEKNIIYLREKSIDQAFPGERNNRNIPDFIVEGKIIIDFKAKAIITKDDYYQMQRYLTSHNLLLGIIVNFRQQYIKPKRIINPEFN